jgi:hypothetical protein
MSKDNIKKNITAAPAEQQNEPIILNKHIGSTNYVVNVYFSQTSKETISDKIMRLIEWEGKYNA